MRNFYRDLSILRDVVVFGRSTRHVAALYGIAPTTVRKAHRRGLKYLIQHELIDGIASPMTPMDLLRTNPLRTQVWEGISKAVRDNKSTTLTKEDLPYNGSPDHPKITVHPKVKSPLEEMVEELKHALKEIKERSIDQRTEIEGLQTALNEADKRVAARDEKIDALEAVSDRYQKQLAQKDEEIFDLAKHITARDEKIESLDEKIESLQAEMGGWKGYARSLEAKIQKSRTSAYRIPGIPALPTITL